MQSLSKLVSAGLVAALVLALVAFPMSAQMQATGTLRGTVTDEFGGVVVGATVTLVPEQGGTERTATTSEEGVYAFSAVAPGRYTVRVAAPGFAAYENAEVAVAAGRRESLDIKLSIALEQEEVNVTSEQGVNTEAENNQSALVLRGADLEALPDDPDDLAAALMALAGPAAGPNGGQIFIDGFSDGRLPPKESIREIRINQNPFSAEFDQLGWGRIEILTRPGSDRLRGQTYFNFGDESLNTRDPFAERRAPFQMRSYGGNLGGPIKKGKASFFFDFDKRDTDGNAVINATVLEPATFQFINAGTPVDPATFALLPFQRTIVTPNRRTTFSPRLDYQINQSNTLVARYSYSRSRQGAVGTSEFGLDFDPFFDIERTYDSVSSDHNFNLTETAILSPTVINETRFQFSRNRRESGRAVDAPTIFVRDAFTAGGAGIGLVDATTDRWELSNGTQWSRGVHSIKFGARVRSIRLSDFSQQNFNGTFVFSGTRSTVAGPTITSIEQFRRVLAAQPGALPTQLTIVGGNPEADVSQADFGAYVQDDWRVRPNFTLSAGLRYENQTNIDSSLNFAPRFSFAYSPGGAGRAAALPKTVIRGGFGVFYTRISEGLTLQARRFNGLNQQQFVITERPLPAECDASPADPVCLSVAEQNARARAILGAFPRVPTIDQLTGFQIAQTTRRVADNIQAPYSIQSTISVERQLPHRVTATVSYINTRTLHLLRSRNINAPLNGVRPLGEAAGNIYQYESSGIFRQNQLILGVNSRLNPRFSVFSNYSLNFAKSDSEGPGTFPANNYDLSNEYGRAGGFSGIRHRLFVGGSFESWWGVRLSPFISAQSGLPFNITTGIDNNGDTQFLDRPAFATDATPAADLRVTRFGRFDIRPDPGQELIPRNYGIGPATLNVNLRLNKTFGFGGSRDADRAQGQPAGGGGGGRRGGAGGGGGGRGGGPRGGGGPFGGGGIFGGPGGGGRSDSRYFITFGVNVQNILNRTNADVPVGNLSSTLFGQSLRTSRFGGFGGGGADAGNRRVELQVRFNF